jgi:DNA-binding response OmpR family regulator
MGENSMLAGPTVLVVEDDPGIAEVLQLALELDGYRVALAQCGEEALAFAQAEPPDLITLDLRLPDLDGHYLLEMLQAETAAARPVIVISAGHYRPCPTDGVVAVLPKPFAVDELQQVVYTVLGSRAVSS